MSEVVITGIGSVLACGAGREALEAALAAGTPTFTSIDTAAGFHARNTARRAALARSVDLAKWVPPARARRLSWPSKFTVAAAEMAVADAGLPRAELASGATATSVATAFGTAGYAEQLMREILLQGPEAASPFLFSESVANAPAAQAAIALGATGSNAAVTQRESGPLQSTILAARELLLGRSRRALAGSYEEMNPLTHAVLGRLRALAPPRGSAPTEGEEVPRPFDRRRTGYLAAEGATMLLLEHAEDAAARGARILARIAAWERAFDATAPGHTWGTGAAALADRLRRGLKRQGVEVESIDRIVSGASGAVAGDRLEAAVLRDLFADRVPPVLAPKGVLGEGAGGHLVAGVLAAAGAPAWPTAGFAEPDPELGLVPHDGTPMPPARRVLVTALAAGGAAAWLVLDAG